MSIKDIDELASERYLQSGDVDARIEDLKGAADPSNYADGDSWESAMGELGELEEFRDEVSGYVGAAHWNNGMTLIGDDAWNEFAEEEAVNAFGREAVESGYFELSRFADELQNQDYKDVMLSGGTFWYR